MKKQSVLAFFIVSLFCSPLFALPSTIEFPILGFPPVAQEPSPFTTEWDSEWFVTDSTVYNHGLARIACMLATTAYQDVDTLNHTDVLSRCYRLLGVEQRHIEYHYDIDYEDPFWGNDQCAFSFAWTKINTSKGPKNLVFVVIRGTPLNANEWISNLRVSSSDKPEVLHDGFLKTSQQIITAFYAYLLEQQLSIHDCCFLLTGHSRGAAISNMLASMLIENRLFTKDNLYVYTFASPNVTTEKKAGGHTYDFIWNIVNAEDVVPTVPLSRNQWQYRKYGHTRTFVNNWNTNHKVYESEILPKINSYFHRIHPRDYTPFKLGSFVPIQITRFLTSFNANVEKYNASVFGLRNKAQKLMWKVFPQKKDEKTVSENFVKTENEPELEKEKKPALVTWLDNLTDGFIDYLLKAANDMHCPETYLSCLMALDEDELYSQAQTNEVVITGATECAVFSGDGELLLRCRDSHIEYTSISLPVAGYQINNASFCIGYPSTENYTIVLYRASLIPTPVSVSVEHYAADGRLISVGEKNKTYLRRGIVKTFEAGTNTAHTDKIEFTRIKGKEASDYVKNGQISRLRKHKISLEGSIDSDRVLSGGITFGTQALYCGLLFGHNTHQKEKSFQFSAGIGTQQILWSRLMINFEAYNHFVNSFADESKLEDSSGTFNFVPAARFTISYKHRKRVELFAGMRFDFHIEDFNDTAFDDAIRQSNLWSIDFSETVQAYPSFIFGLRL